MAITVHHTPVDPTLLWSMLASFIRRIHGIAPTEIWTFYSSPSLRQLFGWGLV